MIKEIIKEKTEILDKLKKVNVSNDKEFKELIKKLREGYFRHALIKAEITERGAEHSHTKAGEILATIISLVYDWEGILGVGRITQEITEGCFDELDFKALDIETAEKMIEINKKNIDFWQRVKAKIEKEKTK